MKVFVIDRQGCEWGGVMEEKAFATQELAQAWVNAEGPTYGEPYYEIIELEVEGA